MGRGSRQTGLNDDDKHLHTFLMFGLKLWTSKKQDIMRHDGSNTSVREICCTKTGCGTTSVWCRGGSRYVEGSGDHLAT